MGDLGDLFGGIGSIIGAAQGGGADDAASQYYQKLIAQMAAVDPNITAQQTGNTALAGEGKDARAAQMDALRQLQNTYQQQGLDASTRSAIAEATTNANRNAQAQGNAVQEQARARGAGRGGVALALQQQAGQNANVNSNQQALMAAGLAQQNRQTAATNAGTLGGAIRGQDYQVGSAQDAIDKYNATMRQNAQQATYANKMGQLGAEGGAYSGVFGADKDNEARIARLWQAGGQAVGQVGDDLDLGAKISKQFQGSGGGSGGSTGSSSTTSAMSYAPWLAEAIA
jgi:hypothetical protein